MEDVTNAAIRWIEKNILERWRGEQQAEAMAENLDAIAREYEIPVRTVIEWIHLLPAESDLSAEAFRRWAVEYAREREQVLARVPKL